MSPATRRNFNPDLTLTFVYHYSPLVALAAGLGFGIYFALADTIIFRSAWPDGQKALLAEPTSTRMLLFGFRALNDELVLRLVAMTTIAAVLVAIAGKRSTWCYWGAIFAVALVVAPLWESTFLASLTGLHWSLCERSPSTQWPPRYGAGSIGATGFSLA